jgi:hypothetical protein
MTTCSSFLPGLIEGYRGDNSDVLVGVCDVWCGGDKCGQSIAHFAAGAICGRWSHCDGHDILRRSYLWRAYEPGSYSCLRNLPALPVGSGLAHLSLSLSLSLLHD